MNDLLTLAVAAHGGIERWNAINTIDADLSITGAIWHFKQQPDALKQVTLKASTREQRVTLTPFPIEGQHSVFTPARVSIEAQDGTLIDARDNPRASYSTHTAETAWDKLHVVYFSGYALWGYLTAPFLYTYPGFVTEEIAPWQENGEAWRRLKINFPESLAAHGREQVAYFGPDGLLRRLDYTVDILGGATGANYATDYQDIDGIKIPMTRRVYARDEQGQKIAEPLLVAIDVKRIALS